MKEILVKYNDEYGTHWYHEELIQCKDCIHRPTINGEYKNGFSLEFPTNRCPCQCEDGYYSWMPKDDWYCGNGEREE